MNQGRAKGNILREKLIGLALAAAVALAGVGAALAYEEPPASPVAAVAPAYWECQPGETLVLDRLCRSGERATLRGVPLDW